VSRSFFSAAEEGVLLAALAPKTDRETQRQVLWLCEQYARKAPVMWAAQARDQRNWHAAANKIQKLAARIARIAERAEFKPIFTAPLRDIEESVKHYKLKGAPRKLAVPLGAQDIAQFYRQASGTRTLPISNVGPLADALRIVYRKQDPRPIIKAIIEYEEEQRAIAAFFERQEEQRSLIRAKKGPTKTRRLSPRTS
jgi:hypothetical protein